MSNDISFEEWFDIFVDEVRRLKYRGPIYKGSFEDNYHDDQSPEFAASQFVKEMQE